MTEFHPEVVKIQKIEKHPNADRLSIYTILDEYPVVDRTGKYDIGELVAYICADAIVPDNEFWHFLAKPQKRDKDGAVLIGPPPVGQVKLKDRIIKAKSIRGTYSEGLIIPAPEGFNEGDDISTYFGITKREYEEELPEKGSDRNEECPKTFQLSKYDLESLAKMNSLFEEGQEVLITEKIEGENCAVIFSEGKLWTKSRNWFKKNEPSSRWWEIPHRYNLEEKLSKYPDLAIYFELYGAVKGWKYDCQVINGQLQRDARIFDIFDLKEKKYLEWDRVEEIAKDIGMKTAPVLYRGPWKTDRSLHYLAEGKSSFGDCVREGFTMRTIPESRHPRSGRKIVKLKGREYKLAKG